MSRIDNPEPKQRSQSEPQGKPYRSPKLVEYGNIQEITQSGGGGAADIPTSQPTM